MKYIQTMLPFICLLNLFAFSVPAPFTRAPKKSVTTKTQKQPTAHSKAHKPQKTAPVYNSIKLRRYDVAEAGDPKLFRGWADVQGQGAANDYCR